VRIDAEELEPEDPNWPLPSPTKEKGHLTVVDLELQSSMKKMGEKKHARKGSDGFPLQIFASHDSSGMESMV